MNACSSAGVLAQTIPNEAIDPGKVHKRYINGDAELKYFVYVPVKRTEHTPMFVSVHGISRNAREHAKMFSPLAERYGVVLVAPLFSRKYFGDYQRLGRKGSGYKDDGRRADHALQQITSEVEYLAGADSSKIFLFGFSGGGQFAHRYTMAYPERIRRVVIGAAGWYTHPDESRKFPYGIAPTPRLKGVKFDARMFLQVPACVLVGQWDTKFDPGINRTRKIQHQQGTTRLERGRRWVDAMNLAAIAQGVDTPYEFSILPKVDHDFTRAIRDGRLGSRVFKYLFGAAPLLDGQTRPLMPPRVGHAREVETVLPATDGAG